MANVTVVRTATSSQIGSLLTQASASVTYATKATPTFSGTVTMSSYNTVGILRNDASGIISSSPGSDLVKTIVNNGALATNYTFTVPVKSQCLIIWSATGYLGTTGLATWTLNVDGSGTSSTSKHYFNSASDHQASPTAFYSAALTAGSHTINISYTGLSDVNDFVYASVIMLPVA
jgi:hypothetical protein